MNQVYEDVEHIDEKEEIVDVCEEDMMLAPREHLESILYQFVNLYERWSEDRQVAAKQGADMAKLMKLFAKEIDGLKNLELIVRDQLVSSIHNATALAAQNVGKELNKEANQVVKKVTERLSDSVIEAQRTLSAYQAEMASNQWIWIGFSMITSIIVSLSIVWLLTPKPMLPLTGKDIQIYELGKTFTDVWPTIPKEKQEWLLSHGKVKEQKAKPVQRDSSSMHQEDTNDIDTPGQFQ